MAILTTMLTDEEKARAQAQAISDEYTRRMGIGGGLGGGVISVPGVTTAQPTPMPNYTGGAQAQPIPNYTGGARAVPVSNEAAVTPAQPVAETTEPVASLNPGGAVDETGNLVPDPTAEAKKRAAGTFDPVAAAKRRAFGGVSAGSGTAQTGTADTATPTDTGTGTDTASGTATGDAAAETESTDINSVYAKALEAALASLKTSYDKSKASILTNADQISAEYQTQMNAAASQSEKNRQAFNEAAGASGLNVGAGGQAALAQNAALQGNLSALGLAQAQDVNAVRTSLQTLYQNYQNQIAEAVANNEYEKAQALLDEYNAKSSAVSSGSSWSGSGSSSADEEVDWTATPEEQAALLAKYGDFSGYLALGYTQAQVDYMRAVWVSNYPDQAYAAGVISADEYYRITGEYPASYTAPTTDATTGTSYSSGTTSSSGYNNGSLSTSQVKELQAYYGATADGLWGAKSTAAAGGLSADAAWAAYQKKKTSGSGSATSSPTASGYSAGYTAAKSAARNMYDGGATASQIAAYLQSKLSAGAITAAEVSGILKSLGL